MWHVVGAFSQALLGPDRQRSQPVCIVIGLAGAQRCCVYPPHGLRHCALQPVLCLKRPTLAPQPASVIVPPTQAAGLVAELERCLCISRAEAIKFGQEVSWLANKVQLPAAGS